MDHDDGHEAGTSPALEPSGEWVRALLPLLVLTSLRDGPSYGYAMLTRLERAGFRGVTGSGLYPLLARLERRRLVATEWRPGDGGPGRKYFVLTEDGHAHAARLCEAWARFTGTAGAFNEIDRSS